MRFDLIVICLALFLSCQQKDRGRAMSQKEMDDCLIEVNRQMAADESARIDRFVETKSWPMSDTGTGLRYWVYQDMGGVHAEDGQLARVRFEARLLDSTLVHAGDVEERFHVGHDDVETGLHEAIQLLGVGDKAYLILPAHLAFGLTGYMKTIPLQSSLVYDIELLGLE